jgi:thiamine monophosphate kinase
VPARAWSAARSALRRVGGRLTTIGRIEAGRGAYLARDSEERPMPAGGWRPFDRTMEPPR